MEIIHLITKISLYMIRKNREDHSIDQGYEDSQDLQTRNKHNSCKLQLLLKLHHMRLF